MQATTLSPIRFGIPVLGALVFAFGMFWTLHALIHRGAHGVSTETMPTIDFVRLKRNVEIETKQRRKPEKPPPPKQPPPPQVKVAAQTQTPQQQVLPFNMPNLNIGANISGGPFIGTFASADSIQGDAELIPLVRIAPQYPRQAMRDGIAGEVTLEITVGPDGQVKSARVKSAKPRGYFESAAVSAAYKGRFRPKVVDGKPQETTGVYTVKFNLGDE